MNKKKTYETPEMLIERFDGDVYMDDVIKGSDFFGEDGWGNLGEDDEFAP